MKYIKQVQINHEYKKNKKVRRKEIKIAGRVGEGKRANGTRMDERK
jgi:hypothetical protein